MTQRNGRQNNQQPSQQQPSTTEMVDRAPPSNRDAECCLLGSVLLMPQVIDEVIGIVAAEDFFDDAHRKIFESMVWMTENGRAIDIALLADRLRSQGDYDLIGGAATITKLFNSVPNAAHAVFYAIEVRNKAILRNVLIASSESIRLVYDAGVRPVPEVVEECQRMFYGATERGLAVNSEPSPVAQSMTLAMQEILARLDGSSIAAIPTGYQRIDELLGGVTKKEVTIVAGRPGMGKTSLAMGFVLNMAQAGHRVLVVSLEMAERELAERLLASHSRVNLHRMRSGTIYGDMRSRLATDAARLSELPIWIEDDAQRTIGQIAAIARRHKRRHQLDVLVIDYLQLVHPENERDPRHEQVSKISRRLKIMARDLDIAVICLAQVNRASTETGRAPRLSELRESGSIEQDSDMVMFVHRPAEFDPNLRDGGSEEAEIHVAKNRNGPTGVATLIWFKEFARFDDRAPDRMADDVGPVDHQYAQDNQGRIF